MYSQHSINDNRKRPIPLNAPAYPSKRPQRLSSVMDRLTLNNDQESSIAPQRTIQNHDPSTSSHAPVETDAMIAFNKFVHNNSPRSQRPKDPVSSLKSPVESDLVQQFNNGEYTPLKKFPSDPRSIKDSDTQRRYLQVITEYLSKTGYVSSSQSRNIRVLSSKEFHAMLKHLVLRWNPNYRPKRKFEDEVMDLLKEMRYPLRDSISRKSLLSIGAIHSNPIFFALLYWVVQMCKANDAVDPDEFEEPVGLEMQRDSLSKAFEDFSTSTYHVYMNTSDDFSLQVNAITNAIDNIALTTKKQINELELELQTLKDRCALLESRASPINDLIKKNQEMTTDIAKFRAYCEGKKKRVTKYQNLNKTVKDEIKRLRKELQTVESNQAEIETKLKNKNISVAELKEVHAIFQADEKKHTELTALLQERRRLYNQKLEILSKLREKVRKDVEEYNLKVKKTFPNVLQNQDMLITYNPDGKTMDDMASIDVNRFIIPKLESLEQSTKDEFAQVNQETHELREVSEAIKAEIDQIKSDLIVKQKELDAKKKKYDENHQNFMAENEKFNRIVDKQERTLEDERSEARSSVLLTKEKLFAQETQFKEMTRTFKQEQETLESKTKDFLNQFNDNQNRLIASTENLLKLAQTQNPQIE